MIPSHMYQMWGMADLPNGGCQQHKGMELLLVS
jgi:hypothetical protein